MPRTRSAAAHRKVLDAALKLIAERGIDGSSMDAVARESGVSKATIYKHWADKDALLLEIMAEMAGLRSRPAFDSGDIRADMVAVLSYRLPEDADLNRRLMPHLVAYSATNPGFGKAWRRMVMEPPRRELTRLLRQGIAQGSFATGLGIEVALTMLLGPMLYWHIFLREAGHSPAALAESVVDAFWKAHAIHPRPNARPRSHAAV